MSITSALSARRETLRNKDDGFTLIELLVVVIIIGILAAIAIPIYIGVQNNAKDSAVKSDLSNIKTAVVAYGTANPSATTAPPLTAASLGTYGFSASTTATPSYAASPTSTPALFCIQETSPATSNVFSVTSNGGVASGACATSSASW